MTPVQVIFLVVAAATVVSAIMVVTVQNLIHAALLLIVTLLEVAIVFVLLEASFIAAVQLVLYIGAIAILIIFAVMLTRRVMQDSGPQTNRNWWVGALFALLLFVALASVGLQADWAGNARADVSASIDLLGRSLVDPDQFVLPFEVASILLIIALIGAVAVAWPGKKQT